MPPIPDNDPLQPVEPNDQSQPKTDRLGQSAFGRKLNARVVLIVIILAVAVLGSLTWVLSHSFGSSPLPSTTNPPVSTAPSSTPPPGSFVVTRYGADATGQRDATAGIRQAIAAAQAAGSGKTVYFPAGTYLLNDNDGAARDFKIDGVAVNILGAGRDSTKIVEKVGTYAYPTLTRGKDVFVFTHVSGFRLSGLTIDSQTYNAGDTIDNYGDNSVIEHARFLGAVSGSGAAGDNKNVFVMRVLAVCNQNPTSPQYNVYHSGNAIRDIILSGLGTGGNDDLDFSCQHNGTISDITDTGWGTALYIDQNVTITNYRFTPGAHNANYPGYYITDSQNITINNFTTSGHGGTIKNPNYPSSNIIINHEKMTNPGFALFIGDVNTVKISNSTISQLKISPTVAASNITVTSSAISSVSCAQQAGATISGLVGIGC